MIRKLFFFAIFFLAIFILFPQNTKAVACPDSFESGSCCYWDPWTTACNPQPDGWAYDSSDCSKPCSEASCSAGGWTGCSSGCSSDSDCGGASCGLNPYCSGNTVVVDCVTAPSCNIIFGTCTDGTPYTSTVETCTGSTGSNYCQGSAVVHDVYSPYCSSAACYTYYSGTETVQDCSGGGWQCSGGVREYIDNSCSGGSCNESVLVSYNCSDNDGWTCSGDTREYRAYDCLGSTCDGYSVYSSEDCSASDGWVDTGSPYSCCDGTLSCGTCQDQEYLSYTCSGGSCGSPSVLSTRTNKTDCAIVAGSCGAPPEAPPNNCDSYDGRYCSGNTSEYRDYISSADCSVYNTYSPIDCTVSNGCSGGYYQDYGCSSGYCSLSSSNCTETCCDSHYGDPDAYCSNGSCYPPAAPPGDCIPDPSCDVAGCDNFDSCDTYCGDCAPDCTPTCDIVGCGNDDGCGNYCGDCGGGGGGNQPPNKPDIPNEYKPSGVTWDNCVFAGQSIPTFYWTYSDPDGDPQAAYEIEVDDSASFQAPKFNHLVNNAATSYALDLNQDDNQDWLSQLDWQTSYHWRVRVKDSVGNWSEWSNQNQFQTPNEAYPYSGFSWSPVSPNQKEVVVFTPDNSGYSYLWTTTSGSGTFTDGTSATSQNPHIVFTSRTNKIRLQVTFGSYSCTSQEYTINANLPLPGYREVSPIIWLKSHYLALKLIFWYI